MNRILLELDRVTFGFGERLLFQQLSGVVCHGERLALLGRSGVGKSTLLRLIGGLLWPDDGRVFWTGDNQKGNSRVGFVFQDHALLPWLSTLENIRLPFRFAGTSVISRELQIERIETIANRLSIAPLLASYPHELSGGMRQRVALARALVTNPQLLCLDEPFSALDPVLRREARDVVDAAIRLSGAATVIVTHDISDAMWIAERIWLLCSEGERTIVETITRGDPGWSEDGLLAAYR